MASAKPNRKHVSHDGTVREYNFQTKTWTIIEQETHHSDCNDEDHTEKPLAIRGRIFDIYEYFPYLNSKQIMNVEALKTLDSAFKINDNVLYIGNMINNELQTRESLNQQHGDTGNNLWDTSVLLVKCLEHNTFNNNDDKWSKILNVSNKNVLELGTGTGFVGLGAIHCNANHVWLTDLEYCIQNIALNVDKNKLIWDHRNTENKQCEENMNPNPFEKVNVFELDWFNVEKSLLKFNKIKKNSVDMIIGSDVIWIKELVPMLVNTLQYLYENVLNKEHGVIIIGEQIRSNMVSELFWSLIKSKGFYRYQIPRKLYHPKFTTNAIQISVVSIQEL
eukprot:41235_1